MGYVYLLLSWDKDGKEVFKVGVSKNDPQLRVQQLQTGNDRVIELLKSYKSPYYKEIEKWLHKKYKTNQTDAKNEWFHLTNIQVFDFHDECSKAHDSIHYLNAHNTLLHSRRRN